MSDFDEAYFNTKTEEARRAGRGAFFKLDEIAGFEVAKGLKLKPVGGEGKLMLSFVYMEPHAVAPMHSHEEEQMGFVIDGEYEFEINGEKRMCRRGDVYWVPPHVPHAAVTYDKGCFAVDVFSPPREAFKALMQAARAQDEHRD